MDVTASQIEEIVRQVVQSMGNGAGSAANTADLPKVAHCAMLVAPKKFEVKEIPIPGDAILVSITRDTEFIIPHGNTVLLPWDRILVLTQDDTLHLLTDAWELNSK